MGITGAGGPDKSTEISVSLDMKDLFIPATGDAGSQRGGVLIHLTTPSYLICCSSYSDLFVKKQKHFEWNTLMSISRWLDPNVNDESERIFSTLLLHFFLTSFFLAFWIPLFSGYILKKVLCSFLFKLSGFSRRSSVCILLPRDSHFDSLSILLKS